MTGQAQRRRFSLENLEFSVVETNRVVELGLG